ncbi:MAG: hypothetical protein Q4C54_00740 [Clostridia bacterium]|nr:hypothetical protein [Clostridia bacterium]
MRKLIALLLAAVMMLGAVSALAEGNKMVVEYDQGMDISLIVPENMEAVEVMQNGVLCLILAGKDEADNLPIVVMLVAADDQHDEAVRFNDLTEEEKKAFAAELFEDDAEAPYEILTSGHGTEAVVVEYDVEGIDSLEVSSLYYGYAIHMYYGYADGHQLTDADKDFAMQLFTDLNFEVK